MKRTFVRGTRHAKEKTSRSPSPVRKQQKPPSHVTPEKPKSPLIRRYTKEKLAHSPPLPSSLHDAASPVAAYSPNVSDVGSYVATSRPATTLCTSPSTLVYGSVCPSSPSPRHYPRDNDRKLYSRSWTLSNASPPTPILDEFGAHPPTPAQTNRRLAREELALLTPPRHHTSRKYASVAMPSDATLLYNTAPAISSSSQRRDSTPLRPSVQDAAAATLTTDLAASTAASPHALPRFKLGKQLSSKEERWQAPSLSGESLDEGSSGLYSIDGNKAWNAPNDLAPSQDTKFTFNKRDRQLLRALRERRLCEEETLLKLRLALFALPINAQAHLKIYQRPGRAAIKEKIAQHFGIFFPTTELNPAIMSTLDKCVCSVPVLAAAYRLLGLHLSQQFPRPRGLILTEAERAESLLSFIGVHRVHRAEEAGYRENLWIRELIEFIVHLGCLLIPINVIRVAPNFWFREAVRRATSMTGINPDLLTGSLNEFSLYSGIVTWTELVRGEKSVNDDVHQFWYRELEQQPESASWGPIKYPTL